MLLPDGPIEAGPPRAVAVQLRIRRADLILAQTETQVRLIQQRFGLSAEISRNICPLNEEDAPAGEPGRQNGAASCGLGDLSPSNESTGALSWPPACRTRRSRLLVESIERRRAAVRSRRARRELANVTLAGYVPPNQIAAYYRAARVLLCTSVSEGFPNTFLEAWRCGTPVVTSTDPDDMVARGQLGAACQDLDELAAALRALCGSDMQWRSVSQRCREQVRQLHDPAPSRRGVGPAIADVVARAPDGGPRGVTVQLIVASEARYSVPCVSSFSSSC